MRWFADFLKNPIFFVKKAILLFAVMAFASAFSLATAQNIGNNSIAAANALAQEVNKGVQVVETPFGKLSFAEIQNHPKRKEILDGMTDSQYSEYDKWQEWKVQAAIAQGEEIDSWTQAAIEANKGKMEAKQAAINEIIQKVPHIIPVYKSKIAAGQKLTMEQKKTLDYLLLIGKPPNWMPRIQKLLSNPQNFARE